MILATSGAIRQPVSREWRAMTESYDMIWVFQLCEFFQLSPYFHVAPKDTMLQNTDSLKSAIKLSFFGFWYCFLTSTDVLAKSQCVLTKILPYN